MSKRIFQHPEPATSGKKYWRSLGQRENTPEFRGWLEREFPQGASEFKGGDVSRRSFLQLMGASMALAGLSFAGCRRPVKHLIPFTRGTEWSIPGKALFFSTSMPTRRGYQPLLAETHDGRPTKIEGNPAHPASKGATDTWAQSSILDLYDPDRARFFKVKGERGLVQKTAADFEKALDELIAGAGDGAGLAFLLESNPSPTRERLRSEIEKKFPKALWAVYEPLGDEAAVEAAKAAFGEGVRAVARIEKADVILSLDADFLGSDGGVVEQRAFASRRKVDGANKMSRLYTVEHHFTITGGAADHRLRVPASQIGAAAIEFAAEIATLTNDAALASLVAAPPKTGAKREWITVAAADLAANRGKSLVLAGSRQPAGVQALVLAINAALGNFGATLVGATATAKTAAGIADVARGIGDKSLTSIIIVGGNPAYNAPVDLDFAAKLKTVPKVVRVGFYEDETSDSVTWHAPLSHYLESWGDGYAADGSYVSVQPMILPLYGGWSELDVLGKFAGLKKTDGLELVQETFKEIVKPNDFTAVWAKFLHDGFVAGETPKPVALALSSEAVGKLVSEKLPIAALDGDSYEVVLVGDAKVDDGRYSNNGWLQELPDPITKLTWDNAALISPATAKKLGVDTSAGFFKDAFHFARIEISVGDRKLDLPALVIPGHAENSITIPLGYGRTKAGRVGTVGITSEGFVTDSDEMTSGGFNAYTLRTSAAPYFITGAKVKVTGKTYKLGVTQEHGTLEGRGPDITRESTLEEYKAKPNFAKTMGMDGHIPKDASLYQHPPLDDIHQWAMTVDLNTCIGCSACMVACQAENNVPIVGKRQVIEGREMHWLRMDRYFASTDENDADPELVSQPMMCQHCENAPCETVCPVNATVHSEDGLNVMAYNRCIGTRYCANNCPFKVRRFNFFDYNERKIAKLRDWNLTSERGMDDSLKLSKNPNVTVRMRGVMEKCTFCVQRIQEAKIAAKVAIRDQGPARIPADTFTSACAQVCPTGAIVFGDKKNPESAVSKLLASERGYRLFEYLSLNQRVTYLARVRNPNPKMPGAEQSGKAIKGSKYNHPHHAEPTHEAAAGASNGGHA